MSADDYDEEAMIAELAAYYGVDPSLISLEAEPITERRRLESAGLGRMRLKVTIVVPEEVDVGGGHRILCHLPVDQLPVPVELTAKT